MAAHACKDGRDLIPRIAAGDLLALAQLYDRYAASVLGLACRILGHQATAERVVLDVFHEVWRTAAHYDPTRSAPDTWLFTLARLRALHAQRTAWSEGKRAEEALPQAVEAPLASRRETQERTWVMTALAGLAPEQRQVLELAYYEGLTQTAIATRLGLPLDTVKTRLCQGLDHLQDRLVTQGWTIL
jgi:RNA polymerase sigma-70 factor (ECF subfamily)